MSSKTPVKNNSKLDLEEYMVMITSKYEKKMIQSKNTKKVDDTNFAIPNFHEYSMLLEYNYNAFQLKSVAKHHKLKVTGNKNQLKQRIYFHLFLSCNVLKIQKVFRGNLQRKYNKCRGPAFINRSLCTNATDFFTMDDTKEISTEQFFSYRDNDGFIYGFDIVSLHHLIYKGDGNVKNPYNRHIISSKVLDEFKSLFRLSKILKIPTCIECKEIESEVSSEKILELRVLSLFQSIDALGNYSNPQWFLSLHRNQLIRFLRELADIWNYRAQLSAEIKQLICPPLGDPFYRFSFHHLQNQESIQDIRKQILTILEKFVHSGIDADNRSLGAYYVLGALTLVNTNAANSLPWLYQSVLYAI